RGVLAGGYGGATAEATIGGGLGANVLVGGLQRSIALQPVSVGAQRGLNAAAGIGGLELYARYSAPRSSKRGLLNGGLFSQRIPFSRDELVAACRLCDVPARGEGEVVRLDQHAIGGDAIEHLASRCHSRRPVHVEDGLPIGMAREQIAVSNSVAHCQHRLAARVNGESRMTGCMAVGRHRDDAGSNFFARLETLYVL